MKNLQTVSKLPVELFDKPQDYVKMQLPKSQEVVGRLITFGVRVSWTEEQMKELASNILVCVDKAMKPVNA
jgi:8-amino-3,8-dideoxy-alpha-D-manno-octulosonate transaminase